MTQYIIESTITAILLFWVISHAGQFNQIASASQQSVVGAVRALSGN